MPVFDVGVHVRPLFRSVATIRTLKPGTLATLILEVPPQSVPLLINFTADFANVALQRLLRKLLLLLRLLTMLLPDGRLRKNKGWKNDRLRKDQGIPQRRIVLPVCCKQVRNETSM